MKRVLVVDDPTGVCELVSATLADEPYTILSVENHQEALERVLDDQPHLIVLDSRSDRVDGLSFCRYLKSNRKTRNIHIVLLSPYTDLLERTYGASERAVSFADSYLTKPFHPRALRELVAHMLDD